MIFGVRVYRSNKLYNVQILQALRSTSESNIINIQINKHNTKYGHVFVQYYIITVMGATYCSYQFRLSI